MLTRRSTIIGALFAPAIIRSPGSLMPISPPKAGSGPKQMWPAGSARKLPQTMAWEMKALAISQRDAKAGQN
jgi:hypothetical protein